MIKKQIVAAVVVSIIAISVANADLILTVDGQNPTGIPLMLEGVGQYQIAIDGNTTFEPNDIRFETVGGILTVISDVNHQYSFQYDTGSTAGLIWLISNTAMTIDDINVPADTTIYEIFIFCNPDVNLTGACGSDLSFFFPPPEEEGGEGDSIEQPSDQTNESLNALDSYDLTISGIHDYNTAMSYSNQTILITSDAFIRYSSLTLQNCIVDIEGSVECVSNLILNNSTISITGNFIGQHGLEITESGPSSIIATGDDTNPGKLTLEGIPGNSISVNSDYILDDTDFIVFESGCSQSSSLKFIDFYGGWSNVLIRNRRLNDAISNCRFFGADYAIYQEGPDEFTDVRFSFFYDNPEVSIYINITATGCTYPEVWLDNVVIDDAFENNSYGVVINGAPDEYCYGYFKMTNSIITKSYCGWAIGDPYVVISFKNVAYYGNTWNDNLIDSNSFQTNPMFLTESPFEGPVEWPYFIKPQSPVAQVDLGYNISVSAPQQLITSIDMNYSPRTDKGIGFGMPILSEAGTGEGDFDSNNIINGNDFTILAIDWLTIKDSPGNPVHFPDADGYSIADFDKNGTVNIFDLSVFCENWLTSSSAINLTVSDAQDLLTVNCQNIDGMEVTSYALFLDRKYIASRDPNNNPILIIDKRKNTKGTHSLMAVIRVSDGNEYLTATQKVVFNSSICDISFDELFNPSNYYIIKGKVNSGYSTTVTIKNIAGQSLWTNSYDTNFIAAVPPSTFSGQIGFEVSYTSQTGTTGQSPTLALEGPPDYRTAGLVICMLESGWTNGSTKYDTGTCRFAAKTMRSNGVYPVPLHGYGTNSQVTYDNLKKVCRKYPNIRYAHIFAHGTYECDSN